MLISSSALQSAILARNTAQLEMMQAHNRMLNRACGFGFGSSQPLKPSAAFPAFGRGFTGCETYDELLIKSNETRVCVLNNLIKALDKARKAGFKNSAPNYSGLNYKA